MAAPNHGDNLRRVQEDRKRAVASAKRTAREQRKKQKAEAKRARKQGKG